MELSLLIWHPGRAAARPHLKFKWLLTFLSEHSNCVYNLPGDFQRIIIAATPFLTAFVDCHSFIYRTFCHCVVALSGISYRVNKKYRLSNVRLTNKNLLQITWIPGVGDISSGTTYILQNSKEHQSQQEDVLHFLR